MPPGAERARMGMRSIGTTGERSHGPCREGGGPRRGTHRRVETAVGGRSGGSRVAGGRGEGVRWNRSPRTGGGLGGALVEQRAGGAMPLGWIRGDVWRGLLASECERKTAWLGLGRRLPDGVPS